MVVAGVAVAAAVATGRAGPSRWVARLAIAAGGGAAVVPFGGLVVGLWLVGGVVLADWAIRGWPPVPRVPADHLARWPATAIAVVAAASGRELFARFTPLLLTASALALTAAIAVSRGGASRAVRRVARAAGRAVTAIALGTVGVVVVVLPGLAHRLAVIDPLGGRAAGGWLARGRPATMPERPWMRDAVTVRRSVGRRLRGALATFVVMVLVAGGVWVAASRDDGRAEAPPAADGATWWHDYRQEERWALFDPGVAIRPMRYPPMSDVRGRYINIDGGRRVSWTAPPCGCRRLRVWMYGGSTTFGLGQRDASTIASEIARLAWDEGLAVDVSNRGVLGDLGWEGAQRFTWDAAVEEPPDVVLFYDGYNEFAGAEYANDAGRGGAPWPVDWTAESFYDERPWFTRIRLGAGAPEGASSVDAPSTQLPAAELGRRVMDRYAAGRLSALAVARELGVTARFYWQPDRYSRPAVEGEPQQPPGAERYRRRARRSIGPALPEDVVDLRDLFRNDPRPVFYDDSHTGERGARVVADAIYADLRPLLGETIGAA